MAARIGICYEMRGGIREGGLRKSKGSALRCNPMKISARGVGGGGAATVIGREDG